jgi:hypothetical protein
MFFDHSQNLQPQFVVLYLYLREDYIEVLLFFKQVGRRSVLIEYGDGRYVASTTYTIIREYLHMSSI